MTDSNHTPNQSSSSSQPDYEGTDPDRFERDKEKSRTGGVSTVQVGASAAAAVTSALAASFFGVAGTLIGAAVGSIVSTIAGALYAEYLGRAHERIKVTREVVIQRIPNEVIAGTPLRRLTGPTALPGRESLRPIGDERGDETVAVPVEEATELLRQPEGMAPLDPTSVLPTHGSSADNAFRAAQAGRSGAGRAGSNGAGGHGPTGTQAGPSPQGRTGGGWRKKSVLAMAAVSAAGFMIALAVVLITETAIGHPVSGGDSGTTISNITKQEKAEVTPTETPSEEPSASPTDTPSATATAEESVAPTATTDPTATEGANVVPTDEPSADSTDQGAQNAGTAAPDATEAP
jgi:hypothetical protein